jgi:hypothetical protein
MRITFRALLLALLLTAACAGPPNESVVEPTDVPVAVAASATVPVEEPTLTSEAAQPDADATEAMAATGAVEPTVGAVTEAPPTETRAPRLALEATDPSTVSLAAGKPQLVEFFAFW